MFWAWFATPVGRRALLILGGCAFLLTLVLYSYEHGKHEGLNNGRKEGTQDTLTSSREESERDRQAFIAQLSVYQQRDQAAQALLSQATQALASANDRLSSVQATRERDNAKVAALTDVELFADITQKLAIRSPADTSPQFNSPEMRRLDAVVTDYPHSIESGAAMLEKVAALEKGQQALQSRTSALEGQRDAAVTYGEQMFSHYVVAYNAAQRLFQPSLIRRIVTLGHAKAKHMDLPDPSTLKKGSPTDVQASGGSSQTNR